MKCRSDDEIRSVRYLTQKIKYNLTLQNDILKCAKKLRSYDNLFTNLGNYLLSEYLALNL